MWSILSVAIFEEERKFTSTQTKGKWDAQSFALAPFVGEFKT